MKEKVSKDSGSHSMKIYLYGIMNLTFHSTALQQILKVHFGSILWGSGADVKSKSLI